MGMPPPLPAAMPPSPASGSNAGWSLALALAGAGLSVLGWIVCYAGMVSQIITKLGTNATQQQIQQATMDMMTSGKLIVVSPAGTMIFLAGAVCGVCAIWLAVRALLRQERGRGMAIASCVIGACFTFCQVLSILIGSAASHAGGLR